MVSAFYLFPFETYNTNALTSVAVQSVEEAQSCRNLFDVGLRSFPPIGSI